MSLRDDILAVPETLSDLAWAAEQRFREAEELLSVQRFSGSLYLFGLASEMWLKLACFRSRAAKLTDTVQSQLAPAKTWMQLHVPGVSHEAYHSLLFWAEYLIRLRQGALSAERVGKLRHHVIKRLYNDWKIDVRYRSFAISQQAAWRVYNDATWIRESWNYLWR